MKNAISSLSFILTCGTLLNVHKLCARLKANQFEGCSDYWSCLRAFSIDLSTNRGKCTFSYIVGGIKVSLPGAEKGTFMLSISHLLFSVRTGGLSGGAAEMGTMTTGLPDPVGDIPSSANTALAFPWASVPFLKNKEKLCVIKIMSWMKIWCRYWNKLCLLY